MYSSGSSLVVLPPKQFAVVLFPPPSKHTAPCVLHPAHAVCLLQVTSDSWQLLHSWYGGGPCITRTAVMEGLAPNSKRARVMLYPMKLEVCWGGKVNEVKTIEVEKHVSGKL